MARRHLVGYITLIASGMSVAQPVITTFAGSVYKFDGDGKRAIQAPLGQITDVAVDGQGRVYIADPSNNMVMRFTPNGNLNVIAGNGKQAYSGDGGPAMSASLGQPNGMAIDPAGNVYVAELTSCVIRKIATDGTISTVAGTGICGFADGPAGMAQFFSPTAIAFDASGNLYIADQHNQRIRKLSTDSMVTTIAGTGSSGSAGDNGQATSATLNGPGGVAVDSHGIIYISDTSNNKIRKIVNGVITTAVGTGSSGVADGGALQATLVRPKRITFDAAGNLYITEGDGSGSNNNIRRLSTANNVITFAGAGPAGFSGDGGSGLTATFNLPSGITLDAAGNVYIADTNNGRVRRIAASGAVSTSAGNGEFGNDGDGGPAVNASFRRPVSVAVDSARNTYVLDSDGERVRKISSSGTITNFAGVGEAGFAGDGGQAVNASLNEGTAILPPGIAADQAGNIYVADAINHRIRKITPDGIITTFAGGGTSKAEGVQATLADLGLVAGLGLDAAGNVYYINSSANTVRKISTDGTVKTVAGGGSSTTGDGVLATTVSLQPQALAVDAAGNFYIAGFPGGRVRKISTSGVITTVTGGPTSGCEGDGGPATAATISLEVYGLAIDSGGNLYISDANCESVRRISAGVISLLAGDGNARLAGDGGPAVAASLNFPEGLALDPDGNVYIADSRNLRIRRVLTVSPSFGATPASLTFSASAGGNPPNAQNLTLTANFSGPAFTVDLSTNDGGSWLATNALSGTLPTVLQVFVDPTGLDPGSYQGTINIRVAGANPPMISVPVALNISVALPPLGSVDPTSLSFSFGRGAGAQTRQINVSNRGGGALTFSASASTNSGGSWLSITGASGSVTPASPAAIGVIVNPSQLAPGTYTGQVVINLGTGDSIRVPVTVTVTSGTQTILLSQTGLTFTAVAGGGLVPGQTFGILNLGQGLMSWTVSASVLSGSVNWLTVTPSSGTTDASSLSVPLVEVDVNQAGLTPGSYYGQIQVLAPGANNSPQAVSVVFNVLPAGTDPGPLIRPTGLIFTTRPGSDPASQNVLVSNLSATSTSFISGRLSDNPGNLFQHQPTSASVDPNSPVTITVSPALASVDPGVYRGTLTLQFSTGPAQTVGLLFVIAGNNAAAGRGARDAQGCAPTKLVALFTTLTYGSPITGGWPTPLEVRVVDDCGNPMVNGAVTASFSNGDPPLSLASLKDGGWTGTWLTQNAALSQVTVTAKANSAGLTGSAQVTLGLQGSAVVPAINPGAVLSAASYATGQPLSPGGFVSIFGTHLSNGLNLSQGAPYQTQLGATQAFLGGRVLPLQFAADGQINAIVPYDVPVNTTVQLVVSNGPSLSVPEPVIIASTEPAVFTADQSGKGAGIVVGVRADQTTYVVDTNHPLSPGDVATIYCAGLGPVSPSVTAGSAASLTTLSNTVNAVTATIGGQNAPVLFAGLAPGFVGLYQVNALVPSGIAAGNGVPLVLMVAGQQSPPVTVSVAAK